MEYTRINQALRNATDTQRVAIGAGELAFADNIFTVSFGDRPAVIVADTTTFALAGKVVHERLVSAGCSVVPPFIFPAEPPLYADYRSVVELEQSLRAHNAVPVAVGSGTLNDITKLAAHHCHRPYMVVGTAASMDGYTAFGAAITRDGFKQTFACPAPRVVVADLDILAQAPPDMTAAGYGDLLGKITAGADWIVADALEIERIDPHIWSLVQGSLRAWIANPQRLPGGDQRAIAQLMEGLIVSGLAMQASQSSRPASGSEHQFSHLWEMEAVGGHSGSTISHGFKVGIGSIASAALYERVLSRDLSRLNIPAVQEAWPTRTMLMRAVAAAHTIPIIAEKAVEESLAKYIDAPQLGKRLALLRERWPDLRDQLTAQLLTADEVRACLQAAGAPTEPERIGVDLPRLQTSYAKARHIRRRYTILDLAAEAGCFDVAVGDLFRPGGFWQRHGDVQAP